ncbi:Protein of unknown function [Lactobacillus helveticus CIRM-BIA 101]
MNNED